MEKLNWFVNLLIKCKNIIWSSFPFIQRMLQMQELKEKTRVFLHKNRINFSHCKRQSIQEINQNTHGDWNNSDILKCGNKNIHYIFSIHNAIYFRAHMVLKVWNKANWPRYVLISTQNYVTPPIYEKHAFC